MFKKLQSIFLTLSILVVLPSLAFAQNKIIGSVTDKQTSEPLPGANVYIDGTNFGAATNLNGRFVIAGVPPGSYVLKITYLGYQPADIDIRVQVDETVTLDAALNVQTVMGEAVEVTAQAEGQMQAINQQISSNSVVNIVSSSKIQELPEANAAEAVGRLPGVSLLREGGEGNKVVIRGLSPQYNKITINGVSIPATGATDLDDENRSVDLSMISPNILDGIEVSKTATADQEADQLGGTVNFVLRGAPERTYFNVTSQGGYNGLRDEVSNYYYILGGGKRFFDNKLGIFFQGNLEKTDRSNNAANADYEIQETDSITVVNNVYYQDINRTNRRTGGVLVLDYSLPSTKIKISNSLNNLDVTSYTKEESFNPSGRVHNYLGRFTERNLFNSLNTLDVEQNIGNYKISGGLSFARSETEIPNEIQMNAYENNAFANDFIYDNASVHPSYVVSKAINSIDQSKVNQFYGRNSESLEEETAARLNFETEFKTSFANFNFKLGGQYKYKKKRYDFEQSEIPLGWNDMTIVRSNLTNKFGLTGYDPSSEDFPYEPFIDFGYDAGDFKSGGDYIISRTPSKDIMLDVYNEVEKMEGVKTIWYDYTDSILDDYHGNENYYAAFLQPKITFANNKVIFIPGVRYESVTTKYTANRSDGPGKPTDPFIYYSYTSKKTHDHLLPMIHFKYQVANWFDIRASYTQTLARPSYNRIIPRWSATGNSISWNNVDLKPAKSNNFDIFFSLYPEKLGLFTVGLFEKQIEGFTFNTTTFISDESQIREDWPDIVNVGGSISGYINNPDEATSRGIEVEWQSNFWFLPGVLRGLVTSVNYTYNHSSVRYPRFAPIYERQPGPLPILRLVGTEDLSYNARLLDQPSHILNFTIGFDYKGFSVRSSMQYKSDVFVSTNFFEEFRTNTEPITLWNMKVRQKLPIDGFQVFMNLNNFSKAVDKTLNNGTNWFTNRGYYGLTADMGISYIIN